MSVSECTHTTYDGRDTTGQNNLTGPPLDMEPATGHNAQGHRTLFHTVGKEGAADCSLEMRPVAVILQTRVRMAHYWT